MNSDRFRFFSLIHRESDLLVGVSHCSNLHEAEAVCREEQSRLYALLSKHIGLYQSFASSLDSLSRPGNIVLAPELETMYRCGLATGTGPMSSVAGLFAERLGKALEKSEEVLIENGGDLYVKNRDELVAVVYAGKVELSGRIGLIIPPGEWGICTSSGTLGHSFSKGKADAVCIVARSAPLADAWATALANQVKGSEDIHPLLERVAEIPEILTCVVIAGGELGIRGEFDTKLLP